MSRKLGALMLSFLLVMLAAMGAFAVTVDDLTVDEDTDYASYAITEGYNYRTRVYADINGDSVPDKVAWEIYPDATNASDDWFTHRIASDDVSIIIEGVLPKYIADGNNDHIIHVVAHVSGDVVSTDADGNPVQDENFNDIYISADISMDVSYGSGLLLSVGEDPSVVGLFPEMITVSYDSSAVESIDSVVDLSRDKYSVSLIFLTSADQVPEYVYYIDENGDKAISYDENYDPITTGNLIDGSIYVCLQIDPSYLQDDPASYISLPSWLAFEVVSSQDSYTYDEYTDAHNADGYAYVKELRIFYSSDHEPQDGEKATVRITGGMIDSNYSTYIDPDYTKYPGDLTIGWNVAYSVVPPIVLEYDELEVSPDCDVSVDLTVNYTEQHPVSIDFTPDISENVKLSATWAESNNASGIITVNIEPVTIADTTYSTDMIVTDTNGKTATAHIIVNVVVPSIVVDPSQDVQLISAYGGSNDVAISWTRVQPIGYTYSPDIDEGFGLSVESDDSTITLAITPTISADWTGTLTILDAYGKSADISLYLQSVVSGEIGVDAEISSTGQSSTITAGDSFTVTLNAGNTYGTTSWSVATNGFTVSPTSATGSTATFTFTAPAGTYGTFSADITATDQSGREKHYAFSRSVVLPRMVISGDFGTFSVIYGSSADATVEYYDAMPVSWEVTPEISADIEVTSDDETITVTLTPTNPANETYETAIYFTDENGYVTSKDIVMAVTVPVISIEPTSVTVDAHNSVTGWEGSAVLSYVSADPASWVADPVIPDGFGFTLTSGDGTITLSIKPELSFIYSTYPAATREHDCKLTITDVYGGTKDITLRLRASDPLAFSITADSPTMTVTAGSSATLKFTASNREYSNVTWTVSPTSSNGVTASISATNSDGTEATLNVSASTSASGSVKLTVTGSNPVNATTVRTDSYTVTVNVTASTPTPSPTSGDVTPPSPQSGDVTPPSPTSDDPTPSTPSIVDTDPGLSTLVSNGYITSNGTITENAFTSESDKPTASFTDLGNVFTKYIVMAFPVREWYVTLGGTRYGPFTVGSFGATANSPKVTPDSTNNAAATIEIDKSQLTTTAQNVDLGVIPTASTNNTIVTTNIGTVSKSSSTGGTNVLGAAGGGCASGFGALMLAAVALIIRKKR